MQNEVGEILLVVSKGPNNRHEFNSKLLDDNQIHYEHEDYLTGFC